MSDLTLEQLTEKVAGLSKIVEKQSALISRTGQQLIEFQVKNVKAKMNEKDTPGNVDLSDYVTNEDIVQLVGELQNQLDSFEDRSINRLFNSKVSSPQDKIQPLTNKDGEASEVFPKTLAEFETLNKADLIKLCDFYELILPDPGNLNKILDDEDSETLEQAHEKLSTNFTNNLHSLSEEDIQELRLELAKYLGLVNYKYH